MTIVNKSPDMVKFESLSQGSVFMDKYSNYCIKIEYTYSNNSNAVFLIDGALTHVDDSEMVQRIKCELIVND